MGNARPAASLHALRGPLWTLAMLAVLAGCRERSGRERAAAKAASTADRAGAKDRAPASPAVQIPWRSDDWAGALARARAEKKPIFVDLWAPWCHTCLSMKQVVMVNPALAPYLDRFVWLEIDTDRPANAPVLEVLAIDVWPTFYVVSPPMAGDQGEARPTIQARHLGAASLAQLRELLDQGEQGHLEAMASAGRLDPASPLGLVRAGDRAAAAGDLAAADRAYGQALAAAPAGWPRTADVLVKQIAARRRGEDKQGCADLGMRESDRAAHGLTAAVTDFADHAHRCADAFDEARARLLRGRLSESVRKVLDAPGSAMSLDDKSDALRLLREMADALGDKETALAHAGRQRDLLDRAAAAAPTPYARMTYSWPRMEVYLYLKEPARLIPEYERAVADLPTEYDPPYRLAGLYLAAGRLDEAMAMAERAKELIYGPRKARVLILIADIYKARGDREAERRAREEVVAYYESLPPGHKSEKNLAAARKALAELP